MLTDDKAENPIPGRKHTFCVWQTLICFAISLFNIFTVPFFVAFHSQDPLPTSLIALNTSSDWLFIGLVVVRVCWCENQCHSASGRRKRNNGSSSSDKALCLSKVAPLKAASSTRAHSVTASSQRQRDVRSAKEDSVQHSISGKNEPAGSEIGMHCIELVAIFPYWLLLWVSGNNNLHQYVPLPTWTARMPRLLLLVPLLARWVIVFDALPSMPKFTVQPTCVVWDSFLKLKMLCLQVSADASEGVVAKN